MSAIQELIHMARNPDHLSYALWQERANAAQAELRELQATQLHSESQAAEISALEERLAERDRSNAALLETLKVFYSAVQQHADSLSWERLRNTGALHRVLDVIRPTGGGG